MTNPTRSQAIKAILDQRTIPDLAALYAPGMEVQVNVGRDGGERVGDYEGHRRQGYSDGASTWYPIRIPKNAMSEPEDNSGLEMTYALGQHAEAIGMTGWEFLSRRSIYVAFDFDAIVGHSERHSKKLTDAELAEVSAQAQAIPWVTVRRSTSGSGLHLYVFFKEPVPTKNHTEHAALGRAVLAMMSGQIGFDFDSKVDACGGNIWVWARKMRGTNGLQLIKQGEHLQDVPPDWQRHLKVVKGERKKVLPKFVEEDARPDAEQLFDELIGQHPAVKLDADHKKLIDYLASNNGYGWWDSDRRILVTHTKHIEKAHAELKMRGVFKTSSPGTELGEQNLWAVPLKGGAWVCRRYTPGVAEADTWEQDGRGWTKCYLNRDPDLKTASRASGGTENVNGGFRFREAEVAAAVVRSLGGDVPELPPAITTRPTIIKPHKDGKRLVVEIEQATHDDPQKMKGWYLDKGKWQRIFTVNSPALMEAEVGVYDDVVRKAVSEARLDSGWFIKDGEKWNHEPKGHVQLALLSLGRKRAEVDMLMGASVLKPWVIVSRPFQDEYPGDRLWNRSRAQFKYPKSEEIGKFPHWRKILEHCGRGLNDALASNGWAQANEIKTGAEYLMLWLASCYQNPYSPLPYLFFYGNQDCGKSIFHEAQDLLISDGMCEVNSVFKPGERFNAPLEGMVVCVVEEMDLKKNKEAYERIKNWVTSPKIMIHKKNIDPYPLPNTTHWIHTANDHTACPIFPGDTRITMIAVPDLDAGQMIPKEEMLELLKKEAPHFLNHLLQLEIPPSGSRLKVPVITTSEKESLAKANQTPLEEFIEGYCHFVPGELILFSEFYDKFFNTLDPFLQGKWSNKVIGRSMPPHFPIGKRGSDSYIGNISWVPNQPDAPPKLKWQLREKILVQNEPANVDR